MAEESNHRRRRAMSSSLGSVDFGESANQRVLKVEDPTQGSQQEEVRYVPPELINRSTVNSTAVTSPEDLERIEREIRQARESQKRARAPEKSVNRLELLTGIGRLVTEVEIEKVKFSLRSLKSRELRYVMEMAAKEASSNIGEAMMIRSYTLAFALFQIDDNPIYSIIGSDEIEDKVFVIDDFEESVASKLWDSYSDMISKGSKGAEEDLGSTPEEVINTIKKS